VLAFVSAGAKSVIGWEWEEHLRNDIFVSLEVKQQMLLAEFGIVQLA